MTSKNTFRLLFSASGMTQAETAQLLGVSHRTVQYWLCEHSPHHPPQMALDALRWHAERAVRHERL